MRTYRLVFKRDDGQAGKVLIVKPELGTPTFELIAGIRHGHQKKDSKVESVEVKGSFGIKS